MARLLPGESPDEAKRRTVHERLRQRRRRLGALKRRLVPEKPSIARQTLKRRLVPKRPIRRLRGSAEE